MQSIYFQRPKIMLLLWSYPNAIVYPQQRYPASLSISGMLNLWLLRCDPITWWIRCSYEVPIKNPRHIYIRYPLVFIKIIPMNVNTYLKKPKGKEDPYTTGSSICSIHGYPHRCAAGEQLWRRSSGSSSYIACNTSHTEKWKRSQLSSCQWKGWSSYKTLKQKAQE